MRKKAQALSMNTIIIAVIALIVLVVLIAIFTGRLGLFTEGINSLGDPTKSCTLNDGVLKDPCSSGEYAIISSDAGQQGKKCCKKVDKT